MNKIKELEKRIEKLEKDTYFDFNGILKVSLRVLVTLLASWVIIPVAMLFCIKTVYIVFKSFWVSAFEDKHYDIVIDLKIY